MTKIASVNSSCLYWSPQQIISHHTSNGCNLKIGDLLATGTISGSEKSARGCLFELTWNGQEAIPVGNDEKRTYLEDGDRLVVRGYAGNGVGFGDAFGEVVTTRLLA
jgi:fumarylacetoacetase